MPDLSPMNAKAREELLQLEQEQPGITLDLIGTFVIDAPKQMRQIETAYASCNPEALKQSAHYLRSGALVLGLSELCEQSRRLEFLEPLHYGSEESNQMVSRLRAELEPLVKALSEQLMRG